MALSSSSTVTDALNQMADNLRWRGNATRAANFLEAIEFLLIQRPQTMSMAGRSLSQADLREMHKKVSDHLDAIDGSSRRASFVKARPI